MDGDRFDALTRTLSAAASSRRRLLMGVAGGALGGLLRLRRVEEAAAAPTCPPKGGCSSACRNTQKVCSCMPTTSGARICVYRCCSDRTCKRDSQCRNTEVCIPRGGRCRWCVDAQSTSVCVTKCSAPTPDYC
jgi:hypothetical protein